MAGKRKFRSPSRGRGSSAGPREGNSGAPGRKNQRLSEEEREKRRVNKLCNICAIPDHFSDKCPDRTTPWVAKKDFKKGRKDFSYLQIVQDSYLKQLNPQTVLWTSRLMTLKALLLYLARSLILEFIRQLIP